MEYKGIEYSVLRTAGPSGWKWIVFLDEDRTQTGFSFTRADAIRDAEWAIDRATKGMNKTK